jgi:hypothetical protein
MTQWILGHQCRDETGDRSRVETLRRSRRREGSKGTHTGEAKHEMGNETGGKEGYDCTATCIGL